MFKNVIISLIISTFLLSSCSQKQPQDAEKVYNSFRSEENLDNKLKMFEGLKETNPDSEFLQPMFSRIVHTYAKNKDFNKANDLLERNAELVTSRNYNSVAWGIFESKENLELGSNLAAKGVELARKDLSKLEETKPEDVSIEDWKSSKENSLAMILDTYGSLENEIGNSEKALTILEEAVKLTGEAEGEVNENYVSTILKVGNIEKAQKLLEKYIGNGTDSDNMKNMLKDVFIKQGNDEKDYETYIKDFEVKAKQKLIEKLNNDIKNEIAENFELKDLDGKIVKLSDFEGKIVVLDFWATWCGPCLQSMPVMKRAVEKFSDVKFLFVNTWERVEDKKQNAIDFISQNNYPFHVLMDDNNEVVEKYAVRGIPTKFIIDGNQKIRFESIGFSGKEEELLQELELMFSMIK